MTDAPSKKPLQSDPALLKPARSSRPGISTALPDHPWQRMKRMLAQSVGKLPTPLVLILLFSLLAAILSGVMLQYSATSRAERGHLAQRLVPDPARPTLDEGRLQGYWLYEAKSGIVMSLRLEKGNYEWIVQPEGMNTTRYFSRGDYKISGNVLILATRDDMGKPFPINGQIADYLPAGFPQLNFYAEENGKLMVWSLPVSERRRIDRDVLTLFPTDPTETMRWIKIRPL